MENIGGNLTATLQKKVTTKNAIGEDVAAWQDVQTLKGFLDLSSGENRWETYNAKIQESTHLFIMDYVALQATAKNGRLVINNEVYEITLIDNPMNLNKHLEIFLKYTGE